MNEAHSLSWPDMLRRDHQYYYYSVFSWPHHQWICWTRLVKAMEAFPPLYVCVWVCVSFFFFLIWRDVSLPSHPFHLSAVLAPVIMAPLGCRVRAASPVYIRTSSPLYSCPSSALLSSISGSAIIECHFQSREVMQQRWYLTKHSDHCCCRSNRGNIEDLERMRQPRRKACLFTVQGGHII